MAHLLCIGWVQVGGAWALCIFSTSIWIRSFLAFTPFLLPPCLFDFAIHANGCLTLVAWRKYVLLGSRSLPFTPLFLITHGLMGWCSYRIGPLSTSFPLLGFIGQHSYYASPFHSSSFLAPIYFFCTSFTLMGLLLNPLGFLGPITTSLPLIIFSGLLAFKPTQLIY